MARISDIKPNPINFEKFQEERNPLIYGQKSFKWDNPKLPEEQERLRRIREAFELPLQKASSLPPRQVKWIIDGWLAEGELTILAGPPGAGKTVLSCAIAAGITRGKGWQLHPEFKVNGKGHVLFLNNEDNVENTLLPRLMAEEADLDFVHFINTRNEHNNETSFSLANDRDYSRLIGLNEYLENNIGLIIIDPIYQVVDGDHGNNSKARKGYENVAMLAKPMGCAVLGIAHTVRKPSDKEPLARIAGSPALREVPRGILLQNKIASGPTANGGTHVLIHVKNSLGEIDNGFEYCVQEVDLPDQNADPIFPKKGLKFHITDTKTGSPEDILKDADRPKAVETFNKTQIAEAFLKSVLADGPKLFIEVEELARNSNITKSTLLLAKTNLKIKAEKQKGHGRSAWSLPDTNEESLCKDQYSLIRGKE